MRPARLALLLCCLPAVACLGGAPPFRLDPALRPIPPLAVSGGYTKLATCPDSDKPKGDGASNPSPEPAREEHPFDLGRTIAFGDVEASVEAMNLASGNQHLLADATLRALRDARQAAGQAQEAAQLAAALGSLGGKTGQRVSAGAAAVVSAIDAVTTLSDLAVDVNEQTTFALRVKRGARTVAVSCASTEVFNQLKPFAKPDFGMTCALVPSVEPPGPRWSLEVRAEGSWHEYHFRGTLRRLDVPSSLAFADQSETFLGNGILLGFDLRADGHQTAAMQYHASRAEVWLLPGDPPGQDIAAATMALAHLYPWPNPCSHASR